MVFYSSLPIWRHLLIFWILLSGAACRWSNSRHNFAGGRHPTSGNDQHPQSTLLEEHFGSNSWGTFLNFFRIFYLLWIFQLMTGLPMLSYAELCIFQLPFPWYQIGQVWPLPTGIPPSAKSKPMYTMRIHTSTTSKSVQYGTEGSRVCHDCTILWVQLLCVPWNGIQYHWSNLMFVSVDLSVNIAISHGSDGEEDEDKMGMAKAIFASVSWLACVHKHTLPMLTLL